MAFNMFKKKCKQDYVINITSIQDLGAYEGKDVVLKWKRGKKEGNHGKFKAMKVANNIALGGSDCAINLHCTLFEKAKPGFYEEKLVQFALESQPGKRIVSGIIDLAQHAGLEGNNRDVVIDLKGKGKIKKARLLLKITSTEGISTGYSENTENLVLTDEDDVSTSLVSDPIHGTLIQKMREKEEKEEEELRKRQLKERDDMIRQDNEKIKNNLEDNADPIKNNVNVIDNTNNTKEGIKLLEQIQEKVEETDCIIDNANKLTEETNISNSVYINEPINKESVNKEVSNENKLENLNIQVSEKEKLSHFFERKRTTTEIIEFLKDCKEICSINETILKYVESLCRNLTPLLNSCLFSKRTITEFNKSDVEQITSKIIMKTILNQNETMTKKGLSNELIKRINKQTFHYLSFYVLDTLFEQPENICCVKGFQFKFFMVYMDMLGMDQEYSSLKEEYTQMGIITDIANVFMQHHCISLNEISTLFPTLSKEIIHKLLVNFHTDEMDQEPVKEGFLESIKQECSSDPLPNRLTFVA